MSGQMECKLLIFLGKKNSLSTSKKVNFEKTKNCSTGTQVSPTTAMVARIVFIW